MAGTSQTRSTPEARLLVVDDEPNIRELLSASLRYAGFEVATAADGQQALALADSFRPDLLVLDVMMPGLDGFGVVRRLRQSGRHTPVLFLTARDAAEDKVSGLTLGGDDYVTKPFSLDEVLARIRAVLRRSAGAQQVTEAPRLSFADIELDEESHEVIKAGDADQPVADRVQAAPLPDGQRRAGAVEGADPRPRVELRLQRRGQRRRVLHLLPAPQDRHDRAAAPAHDPRGRLHAAAAPRGA